LWPSRPSAKKCAKFQIDRWKVPQLVKARAFCPLILARACAPFLKAFLGF
jgi:hypothetical protein